MKRTLSAAAICLLMSSPALADEQQITIKNHAFTPKDITVAPGTKVTWTNADNDPHNVYEKSAKFHSAALDTKDTFSTTLTAPGKYEYFCTLHPTMTGSITVTASAGK